jgi:hypothetical protein
VDHAAGTVNLALTVDLIRPPDVRGLATGIAFGVLGWLPWLPGFLKQASQVDAEFWLPAPSVHAGVEHLRNLLAAYASGALTVPVALAAVALACAGARRLARRPAGLLLPALLVGPLMLELLVSLRRPIFYAQTLVWTSVPLVVLAAVALVGLRPCRAAVAAGAMIVLITTSLVSYYRAGSIEDWKGAALYLASVAQPGDVVLFNAGWTRIPFDFYYRDAGPRVEEHGVPVELFERGILEPKMTRADLARVDQLTANHQHVWLVYSHDWYTDPDGLAGARLDATLHRVSERTFTAIRIREYQTTTIGSQGGESE